MLTAESSHKVRHFSGAVNYVIRAYESYRPTTTDDAPSRLRLDGQLQDPVPVPIAAPSLQRLLKVSFTPNALTQFGT